MKHDRLPAIDEIAERIRSLGVRAPGSYSEFGKLTGISQIRELGTLETPILLTGTLSVPRVADALISHMLALPGNEDVRSINPVVGETNDGYLSDGRARPMAQHLLGQQSDDVIALDETTLVVE